MATALQPDPTDVFGRRLAAVFIDGAIVLVPAITLASTEIKSFDLNGADGAQFCRAYRDRFERACVEVDGTAFYDEGDAAVIGWGSMMALAVVLYVLLQGLTGWTIGKLLTGIRTVREDGSRPGIGKALLRWLMWIVDGLPFFGLVAFITGLTTVGHRRVGDMVAKTFVVDRSAMGAPIRVGVMGAGHPPPPYAGEPSTPGAWGDIPPPPPLAHPPPMAKPGPQWDEARNTYIQWDPEASDWMQWNDNAKVWHPIAAPDPLSLFPDEPPPDEPPTGPAEEGRTSDAPSPPDAPPPPPPPEAR